MSPPWCGTPSNGLGRVRPCWRSVLPATSLRGARPRRSALVLDACYGGRCDRSVPPISVATDVVEAPAAATGRGRCLRAAARGADAASRLAGLGDVVASGRNMPDLRSSCSRNPSLRRRRSGRTLDLLRHHQQVLVPDDDAALGSLIDLADERFQLTACALVHLGRKHPLCHDRAAMALEHRTHLFE